MYLYFRRSIDWMCSPEPFKASANENLPVCLRKDDYPDRISVVPLNSQACHRRSRLPGDDTVVQSVVFISSQKCVQSDLGQKKARNCRGGFDREARHMFDVRHSDTLRDRGSGINHGADDSPHRTQCELSKTQRHPVYDQKQVPAVANVDVAAVDRIKHPIMVSTCPLPHAKLLNASLGHPARPVFCITIYPYYGDWSNVMTAAAPPEEFRLALERVVERLRADGLGSRI